MPSLSLDDFAVHLPLPILWGDMDSYQHVNNTVYFRWFESARIAYFERMGILQGEIGPILASTSCRFKAPLFYPDDVTAAARVTEVKEDRFHMEYAVFSKRAGRDAAAGTGLVVAYNYEAQQKAVLPAEWTAAIEAIESSK